MEEKQFIVSFINFYFIALGVIMGGSMMGGIGALIVRQPALKVISRLTNSLRIWALVAAIGGTFDALNNFQIGLFSGGTLSIFKQILLIISAMLGAQTGVKLIEWLTQEKTKI
jgi:hypothetical protein